jgi:hypothetical protein
MLGSVNFVSRAQRGPSLASLVHSCGPPYYNATEAGGNDPDPARFHGAEWIEAPHALGGGVVYALTHNDYTNATAARAGAHSNETYLYASVTLFASRDDGLTWAPARPPPAHIVAVSPYVNVAGDMGVGIGFGMPSSVFLDPTPAGDGWAYTLLLASWGKTVGLQPGGLCLARTRDVSDPGSWRAWDGSAFSVSLNATRLLDPSVDPAQHVCAPLVDASGALLGLRHLSLLYSTFFKRYLLFGEGGDALPGEWAFTLSDDLVHWDVPTAVETAGLVRQTGNGTLAPIDPMPGRFVQREGGGSGTWWESPAGDAKTPVGSCAPCPGVDACANNTILPAAQFDALLNATYPFTCSLVFEGSGYGDFVYSTLIDPTANGGGGEWGGGMGGGGGGEGGGGGGGAGGDPNFALVGEDAYLFLVGRRCAGALYDRATGSLSCTPLDAMQRDERDVVRASVRFGV